jgi:hypothetical protein
MRPICWVSVAPCARPDEVQAIQARDVDALVGHRGQDHAAAGIGALGDLRALARRTPTRVS